MIYIYNKYAWGIVLKNKMASTSTLFNQWIPILKIKHPKMILSDNGPEFKNNKLHEELKKLNIKQLFPENYRPLGQIENSYLEILQCLIPKYG